MSSELVKADITVEYLDHMGNDLTVANVARVSFNKWSEEFTTRQDREKGSDEGIIDYLATHNHWCYDDKTEIFTKEGWKLFKDLSVNTEVANVYGWEEDTFKFKFVVPEKIHSSEYDGYMIEGYGSSVDYCVTPHHKMLFKRRNKKGLSKDWETGNSDVVMGKEKVFKTTAKLDFEHDQSLLEMGRLFGFMLGDGGISTSGRCVVRLKRERKINYLTSLLNTVGVDFSTKQTVGNVTEFVFNSNYEMYKDGEKWLDISYVLSMGGSFCEGVYQGLLASDGSKKRNTFIFYNSSKNVVDGFCFLATLCGKNPVMNKPRHGEGNHRLNYRVCVQTRDTVCINKSELANKERIVGYKGVVSCVTVPSGMLLVRRNGRQLICGNTPFGHPQVMLRVKAPVPIRTQCFKSKIGFVENEESRRYISTIPELFIPDEFRSKPDGNKKQGSGSVHEKSEDWKAIYINICNRSIGIYDAMIYDGVAPEQARFVLPQGVMVNWIWTGSLAAYARFVNLRKDPHAQKEVKIVADEVDRIVNGLFPYSWKYLVNNNN